MVNMHKRLRRKLLKCVSRQIIHIEMNNLREELEKCDKTADIEYTVNEARESMTKRVVALYGDKLGLNVFTGVQVDCVTKSRTTSSSFGAPDSRSNTPYASSSPLLALFLRLTIVCLFFYFQYRFSE